MSHSAFRRLPINYSLSRHNTVESSNEDFRSVIDDLTIENRRLRKKLKKYEQIHCGKLQNDKMFELRVHGLPASKKRKLERTLQDFASSLGDTVDDELPFTYSQNLARRPNRQLAPVHHTSSSSTSNSRPVDSAYASMSTSGGNNSVPQYRKIDQTGNFNPALNNDQHVRSYLQTIARGLRPQHPPVMSEHAKKSLVVKRLEQLFTGSKDNSSKLSQSKQQQEVSQSAAHADRREVEARGHQVEAEGSREAKICQSEDQIPQPRLYYNVDQADDSSSRDTSASGVTPEQRPTRPLDLDPSRAQNPQENIGYIKHLGFSSPNMDLDRTMQGNEGWVYLNLLIGMAQLHILNVTPDLVRSAVRELSTSFELSTDGTQIKWKGGKHGTKLSSDSGETSEHSSAYSYEPGVLPTGQSKSSKLSAENQSGLSGYHQSLHDPSSGSYNHSSDQQRPLLLSQTNPEEPYQYRPLFYHAPRSEDEEVYSYDGNGHSLLSEPMNSRAFDPDSAQLGGITKTASRSRTRNRADPIIFYNRARFYTDLSKDDESMPYNCPLYIKHTNGIVGCEELQSPPNEVFETKGPMSNPLNCDPPTLLDQSDYGDSLGDFIEASQQDGQHSVPIWHLSEFEVSGLGGVVPGDHFVLQVDVRFEMRTNLESTQSQVIASRTIELPPSNLPPPSYAFLAFSSSGSGSDGGELGDDSDQEMDDKAYDDNVNAFVPPRFLNSFSSEAVTDQSPGVDGSDDSSIDLLAHARELEPETVAAREREFDENASHSELEMDLDRAASSVAATAGDRSMVDGESSINKDVAKAMCSGRKG